MLTEDFTDRRERAPLAFELLLRLGLSMTSPDAIALGPGRSGTVALRSAGP
jgi:hypothetical protein